MQPLVSRKTALAQAALDHALHFLESGNNNQAAIYYQFAAQQLQSAVKSLVLADVTRTWADASVLQEYNDPASGQCLQAQNEGRVCQPDE